MTYFVVATGGKNFLPPVVHRPDRHKMWHGHRGGHWWGCDGLSVRVTYSKMGITCSRLISVSSICLLLPVSHSHHYFTFNMNLKLYYTFYIKIRLFHRLQRAALHPWQRVPGVLSQLPALLPATGGGMHHLLLPHPDCAQTAGEISTNISSTQLTGA